MNYQDSHSRLDTTIKILKVNHAGEFGAINIYKAQQLVCRFLNPSRLPLLREFESDESVIQTMQSILEDEINHRDTGFEQGGASNYLYAPLRFAISTFTEFVIRIGMR